MIEILAKKRTQIRIITRALGNGKSLPVLGTEEVPDHIPVPAGR
jgi:hypothetical protein